MGPCGLCGEVGHPVFWVAFIEHFTSTNEFWAFSAPACVSKAATVDAVSGVICGAVGSAVLLSTGSTGVRRGRTASSYVTVALTLRTANGFLFVLADSKTLVGNTESISQDVIRSGCVSNLEESEGLTLAWGASTVEF